MLLVDVLSFGWDSYEITLHYPEKPWSLAIRIRLSASANGRRPFGRCRMACPVARGRWSKGWDWRDGNRQAHIDPLYDYIYISIVCILHIYIYTYACICTCVYICSAPLNSFFYKVKQHMDSSTYVLLRLIVAYEKYTYAYIYMSITGGLIRWCLGAEHRNLRVYLQYVCIALHKK